MSNIEVKVETYYQKQAKEVVDMMFEKKIFNTNLTRNDLQYIEDYLAFMYQSISDSSTKTAKIMASLKGNV